MAKTSPGSLSRGLEFEIIGDYTHPSPFLKKKKRNLFNPPLWSSFEGRPGTAGIHHSPKKSAEHTEPGGALAPACREEGQLASEQEVLGLRRHLATDHSGQWGHHWPAGLCGELSWKMEGLSREFSVDLRV